METHTREKTIKVHTLVIDDSEIEMFIGNPDPLIDTLRDLLISKPQPNGNGQSTAKASGPKKKKQRAGATANCQYCARVISTRQIGRHERTCPDRPLAVSIES